METNPVDVVPPDGYAPTVMLPMDFDWDYHFNGPFLKVEFLENYEGPDEFEPAHAGDAGIDLYAADYAQILPGEWALVPCGIRIALPPGTEGQVRPKSGLALKKGMVVLNAPGTIDEGYRGEVQVIVHNVAPVVTVEEFRKVLNTPDVQLPFGGQHIGGTITTDQLRPILTGIIDRTLVIQPGDKLAQLVIATYERPTVRYVESLDDTDRGSQGFGSSGFTYYGVSGGGVSTTMMSATTHTEANVPKTATGSGELEP